jgi:hypothetical protein
MRTLRILVIAIAAVAETACSSGASGSYFQLVRLDSTAVPALLTDPQFAYTTLDSGSVRLLGGGGIHRSLHFTDYQPNPTDTVALDTVHVLYEGRYDRQGDQLIITYPDTVGISGADTAWLQGDSLTITLRPTLLWSRRLLHFRRTGIFCDPISGPCESP